MDTCRYGIVTEESVEQRLDSLLEFCGNLEGELKELRATLRLVLDGAAAARVYLA